MRHIFTTCILPPAKDTSCSTNLSAYGAVHEYSVITVTCSITYSGNWAPVMRWFNSVTRRNFINVTTDDQSRVITSQLTVTVSRDLNGTEIVCATYFTQPLSSLPTNATNIPSYSYNWTSPRLEVILPCKYLMHPHLAFDCVKTAW